MQSTSVKNRGKLLRVVSVLCVVAGTVPAYGQLAAVNGSGPITKFDSVDEIVNQCTTSKTFGLVPSMVRTFTLGGTTNAKVAVMFQGSLSISGMAFDTGFIRLTIDGVVQSPGEIPAIGADGNGDLASGTHGFNWQSATLTPGSHTARVQWRTDLGSSLCADARSLIVLHR